MDVVAGMRWRIDRKDGVDKSLEKQPRDGERAAWKVPGVPRASCNDT